MSLKQNVVHYAKEKNISIYVLEKEADIAKGSISRWDDIRPRIDNVKSMADKLGVTVDQLLADSDKVSEMTPKEIVG